MRLRASHHALAPPILDDRLGGFRARPVEAIERSPWYDAIAVIEEEQHLRVPVIGRQRPTMTKDNRLSFAPVLVIDVDVSSIFFSYSYVWHSSFLCMFVDDSLSAAFYLSWESSAVS